MHGLLHTWRHCASVPVICSARSCAGICRPTSATFEIGITSTERQRACIPRVQAFWISWMGWADHVKLMRLERHRCQLSANQRVVPR